MIYLMKRDLWKESTMLIKNKDDELCFLWGFM